MRESTKSRRDRGFNLVELLVVIAIIGILAGLLLPVLARAKAQGRRVQCLNNQKQLSLTWTMYSGDHNDALVLNGGGMPSGLGDNRLWVIGDSHFYFPAFTNVEMLINPKYAAFGDYLKAAAVYKCPEDKSLLRHHLSATPGNHASGIPKIRSYSLNVYLGYQQSAHVSTGYKLFKKTSDITGIAPGKLFAFQDVHPDNVCYPGFVVNMPEDAEALFHYPSGLHHRRGILSFADGHSETRRWADPRTAPAVTSGILAHWNTSAGNADLSWLRERATYRDSTSVRP